VYLSVPDHSSFIGILLPASYIQTGMPCRLLTYIGGHLCATCKGAVQLKLTQNEELDTWFFCGLWGEPEVNVILS
jgi:hypothetical protein